jgi:hypothetical protein
LDKAKLVPQTGRVKLRDRLAALIGRSIYQTDDPTLPSIDSPKVEKIRKAMNGQLVPLPTTRTRWFLSDLESAEYLADQGDMSMAAQLMRAAMKDGVLRGVLSTRTDGLVRLPKKFRGEAEIVQALELGHDSVRSVFDEMLPPAELAAMAADGLLLGVAVGELVPVVGRDYPVLVRLDPEYLVYRWQEDRWYYRSSVGLLPITPGDGRWVLHTPGGRIAPWQSGIWRAIAYAYIRKTHAGLHKDAWEAKLANPARVAVAPQGASEPQKQAWWRAVMAWGVNSVFGVTPGYDVKLLESNGRGYESFSDTQDRADREMIICVAGQVVTTDGGAGFQNSDIHKSIRSDLIQATADSLAYTINAQVIPAFVVKRWNEGMLERSACVAWDVTPPKDRNGEATATNTTAQAIKALDEALAPHDVVADVKQICERAGIPTRAREAGDPKIVAEGSEAPANDQVAASRIAASAPTARIQAGAFPFAEDGVERPGPGQAPSAFRIWKSGLTRTDKGDSIFNARVAEALLIEQATRGTLYSIDVDHMSLNSNAPIESHKAVGWHRLGVRLDKAGEPELWAVDLQWSDTVKGGLEKDPPEWRYFSPAYDVDKNTREVIRYLNTALTNNPATWQVTALANIAATKASGESIMKMSDIAAALRAMAEGDGDDARTAKALCAMLDDGDKDKATKASDGDDAEKKDDDKDKEKSESTKASDGDDAEKDDDKSEKASIAASAPASNVIDLAKRVHELEVERAKEKEDAEIERLFASRPDFSDDVRKTLTKAGIEAVRDAVKSWKRGPAAASTVKDAQAATTVHATRGDGQGDPNKGQGLAADESRALKLRMGLATDDNFIAHTLYSSTFRALPAADAQRVLASKKGASK